MPAETWLHIRGARRLPIVRQSSATECGLACVAMIARFYGAPVDLSMLRRFGSISMKGATIASIAKACATLQLSSRALRCELSELSKLSTPCILHWRFNHFVVLKAVTKAGLVLHDPARGIVTEALTTAENQFTGIVLEVASTEALAPRRTPRQLSLLHLMSGNAGLRAKFAAGLLLALLGEALLITAPFYLQLVIDHVLAKSDHQLLVVIALAFSMALLIQMLANALRQLTFAFLGHVSVFDITTRVLRRLFGLPLSFFRSRELGDIQHRVQSLSRIQAFLVQAAPALVLDSIFIVLTVALMVLYDAILTALMLVALALWCFWRLSILSRSLRLSGDIAQTESATQTHFLESLRAIQTIKMANGEVQREADWRNLFADSINARIRASNLQVVDASVRQLLFQGARILAIFLLAERTLRGEMSIGMLSAFVAYLGMFTARACGIVDRLLEYRMLDVPLTRLADIVFSEEEASQADNCGRQIGDIELANVSFSYSKDEPEVLRHCTAMFESGSFTAIAGPSGVGKSSLLQLLAGNNQIATGTLTLGGYAAKSWNLYSWRSQLAAVFQGDCLLKGSIAENIALFETAMDIDRVREVASLACIDNEIMALPMAYETRIGDLGAALSRGQVQRVLLARAFYRQPPLLLLDEATSGLDHALEKDVIASIRAFPATRVVVTHSDSMLAAADRVLWLHDGRLLSSRPDLNV